MHQIMEDVSQGQKLQENASVQKKNNFFLNFLKRSHHLNHLRRNILKPFSNSIYTKVNISTKKIYKYKSKYISKGGFSIL